MSPNIGIIGKGRVGRALTRGLQQAEYAVKSVGRDRDGVQRIGAWADVIILAVPYGEIDETLEELGGTVDGKIVIDVTNALTPDYRLALGYSTSGAEELQKKLPSARVVKAFNTVFAANMETGRVKEQRLTAFVASDDREAKQTALAFAAAIGFDAVDAGELQNARLLEPLGYLNIQLGAKLGMGTDIGFELVH
jgi:predicted dinucleotide-binding enzyme